MSKHHSSITNLRYLFAIKISRIVSVQTYYRYVLDTFQCYFFGSCLIYRFALDEVQSKSQGQGKLEAEKQRDRGRNSRSVQRSFGTFVTKIDLITTLFC